jgi:hypothetical protein
MLYHNLCSYFGVYNLVTIRTVHGMNNIKYVQPGLTPKATHFAHTMSLFVPHNYPNKQQLSSNQFLHERQ